jgi:hypothetical protein
MEFILIFHPKYNKYSIQKNKNKKFYHLISILYFYLLFINKSIDINIDINFAIS